MGISIGMVEFNSISKGIECADAMLKASFVTLLSCKTTCPGKYIVMLQGEVAAVSSAVSAAEAAGGENVVDSIVIPHVDDSICAALSGATDPEPSGALGIMEFFCMSAAIAAADTAVKAANVALIEVRLGMGIGGKAFVTLCGDVAAVEAAVSAGISEAARNGMLLSSCVIPAADKELFASIL